MKKLALIMLFVSLYSCDRGPWEEILVRGQVLNPTDSFIEVFYYRNYINHAQEHTAVALDGTNRFEGRLPLDRGRFVYLRMPRLNIRLYLRPGADVNVVMDADNPNFIPRITGEKASESQFLVNYHWEVESRYSRMMILHQLEEMEPVAFLQHMQEVYHKKLEYLQRFDKYQELDAEFVDLMQTEFLYEHYGLLLEYPRAYAQFHPQGKEAALPADYFDFLKDPDLFDDEHLHSLAYISFVGNYLVHRRAEYEPEDEEYSGFALRYRMIRELLRGDTHDLMLSQVLVSQMNFGDLRLAGQLMEDYVTVVQNPQYQEVVTTEYNRVMALAPGNPAPEFSLEDIHGRQLTLGDLRGNIVYLGFWASWCGVCMAQMPFAAELKDSLASHHDLVFLYVSVDTEEDSWRRAIQQHQIEGIHLNAAGFDHQLPASYNLRQVPEYFIIGRDGNIFLNRAPRPENPQTLQVLLDALNK